MTEKVTLPVKAGRLIPPVWETRDGAKNWAAILRPTLEEGITRLWLDGFGERGSYSAAKLVVGEVVEFGADRVIDGPKGGKKSQQIQNRWYGVVRGISSEQIEIERYESDMQALLSTDVGRERLQGNGASYRSLAARYDELKGQLHSIAILEQRQRIMDEMRLVEMKLALDHLLGKDPMQAGELATDYEMLA